MKETDYLLLFCERFGIPEHLAKYVPGLFSENEIRAALENTPNRFSEPEYPEEWLDAEYRKGFLNKTGEPGVYQLNNLYGMLDVFVVSRKQEYDCLFSREEKQELDDWYFDAYFSRLVPDEKGRLTEDQVLTLEETLERIDSDPRDIFLNYCDCRSLTGFCQKPTKTCLTFKNGPNTFADRGLSTPLTKEEAKEIVRGADREGLMHTTMSGGICNCCSDCCYLFRSQRRAGTYGIWPAAKWIVSLEEEKCVRCGYCIRRCALNVFAKTEDGIVMDRTRCAGCGLCVSTCPKKALSLTARNGGEDSELRSIPNE